MSDTGSDSDSDIDTKLANLIRYGEVCEVDPVTMTARVMFAEDNNKSSYNMQIIVPNTYQNRDYCLPDLHEDVLCIFLPGGNENGFIIGSAYAGDVKPPSNNPHDRMVKFSDDTFVVYNRETHQMDIVDQETHVHLDREELTIDTPVQVRITTKYAEINASHDVQINANKNIKIQAGGNIDIGANGSIDIHAGGPVDIDGSAITLN